MNSHSKTSGRYHLLPIETIGLPVRAENALKRKGAITVGDALRLFPSGLDNARGIGRKMRVESVEAINMFLASVGQSGISVRRADNSGKAADTRREYPRSEVLFGELSGKLAEIIPRLLDEYLIRERPDVRSRDRDIIGKRFGLNGVDFHTLEEIGTHYSLTRERIRQIEAHIVGHLAAMLSGGNLRTKWAIDNVAVKSFSRLQTSLEEGDCILLDHEVSRILAANNQAPFPDDYRLLLMRLCGYRNFPTSISGFRGKIKAAWCKPNIYNKRQIERLFAIFDTLYDSAEKKERSAIIAAARRKQKILSDEFINAALNVCHDFQFNGDEVSVKFLALKTAADRAYRILATAGSPLHYKEIQGRVDAECRACGSRVTAVRSLTNHLGSDKRFSPIGRSGQWGLKEWNIPNVTILEALELVLQNHGAPMKFPEIKDEMKNFRSDAAVGSLNACLYRTPDNFVRLKDDKIGLASWPVDPADLRTRKKHRRISHREFLEHVKSVFGTSTEMPLPDLVHALMALTGQSENAIRLRINSRAYIKTTPRGRASIAKYLPGNVAPQNELDPAPLRHRVYAEVRSILESNPNVPLRKDLLYKTVTKNVPCHRYTFYHYLSEMRDIKHFRQGNNHFAVYEHQSQSRPKIMRTS